MQETQNREGGLEQEFFQAPNQKALKRQMEERFIELKEKGHTLVRRVPISMRAYRKAVKKKNKAAKKSRARNRKG